MSVKVIIKDNFFNTDHLKVLETMNLQKIRNDSIKQYNNAINDNLKILSNDVLNKDFLIDLQKSYHNEAIEILKQLCPEKVKLYDYSEFHVMETGSEYKFPIHDDTPNKLLSGVVYIKPNHNNGTFFYENKNGDGKKEIPWKKNRAVFFSRSERVSWHSFEGDGQNNRVAIVYNLMTNRLKEVYKVENKNFLIGMTRYKLNPYLFRFFHFVL